MIKYLSSQVEDFESLNLTSNPFICKMKAHQLKNELVWKLNEIYKVLERVTVHIKHKPGGQLLLLTWSGRTGLNKTCE